MVLAIEQRNMIFLLTCVLVAGSMYTPSKVSLADMAYAKIERTDIGLAKVVYPIKHTPQTLMVSQLAFDDDVDDDDDDHRN